MATFAGIYDGPPRHYGSTSTDKRYVAIHNTSNDATAEGEASYAKRREDSVSSHYYVDNDSIVQSLNTDLRAYHAGSTIGNSQAIAYEITGTNGKSRAWWMANVAWPLLARQIALDCREHAIEPRLLSVAEIKAGKLTGIITHDQMRQAWGGTTHTDPGGNFPLDHLEALVRAELNGGDDDMGNYCNQGDTNENVRRLQLALNRISAGVTDPNTAKPYVPLTVDAKYGQSTADRLKALLDGNGKNYNAEMDLRMDAALARLAVPPAKDGVDGVDGKDGRDGVVPDGAEFVMKAPPAQG